MSLSVDSLACSDDVTAASSAPLTWTFSVLAMPDFTPAQRASRATEPAAWITQSTFLPPSWAIRCPAVWPARFSSDPKYIDAPVSPYWSMPELKATTGIFAATADCTEDFRASGVASVVAIPLTLESTALWISVACLLGSGSLE